MNRAVKIGILSGAGLGFLEGIYHAVDHGIEGFFLGFTIGGILFGGTFGLMIYIFRKLADKNNSPANKGGSGVHQVREISLPLPENQVYDICTEAVKKLNVNKVNTELRERGILTAETGFTMKSAGERIEFILTKKEDGVLVNISSKPTLSTVLHDWGKSKENVEIITSTLLAEGNK